MRDQALVEELDAAGVCAAAERVHASMVAAEVEQFYLAVHWLDLHSGEELEAQRRRSGSRALPGMERAKRSGADGTPLVEEFAAMEFGALVRMGFTAADCYIRDAANTRHRHPSLWAALGERRGRVWQARKVSRMCAAAGLTRDQARWVDAVTTPYVGSLPWGRFESLVEAKIIEADPQAAEQRRQAAALARFVRTGQSDEHGLKTLVARASAGDVIFFVAMVDRIAEILALQGDPDPVDVRRSKAVGILATPARALLMLQQAAAEEDGSAEGDSARDDSARDDSGEDEDTDGDQTDADQTDADQASTDGSGPGSGNLPASVDPKKLLPPAVLHIHLSEEVLRGQGGVARMEGVGPITVEQVREFLGSCHVQPVQVLDVAGQRPVDGYEVPERMREALHQRHPACSSPWGTNLSRRKDAEHVIPYVRPDRGGPPGQTSLANLTLLSRFPHRVKTHGRWRLRQPAPGVLQWRSPHGYWFRVDHRGTHPLGKEATPGAAPAQTWQPHVRLDVSGFAHWG